MEDVAVLGSFVTALLAMTRSEHETYINIILLIIPYCHCEGGYQPTAATESRRYGPTSSIPGELSLCYQLSISAQVYPFGAS